MQDPGQHGSSAPASKREPGISVSQETSRSKCHTVTARRRALGTCRRATHRRNHSIENQAWIRAAPERLSCCTRNSQEAYMIKIVPALGGAAIAALCAAGCLVRGEPYDPYDPYQPGPTADLYDGCFTSDVCFDSECWSITVAYDDAYVTDDMCTYECDSDADCDLGGYCLEISGGTPLCFEPCYDDLDCSVGFACVADEFGYDPVCLPW